MITSWDPIFEAIADSPDDYLREEGEVWLVRYGKEFTFSVKDVAGIGLAVQVSAGDKGPTFVALPAFVQGQLLDLQNLAGQLNKTLTKRQSQRPVPYIDGPVSVEEEDATNLAPSGKSTLQRLIAISRPDATHLIELMGAAGQGKTMLLEDLAVQSAAGYAPQANPAPIVLPIDLLGRYVGTIDDAIAGALNNTYLARGLAQKDLSVCIAKRWIALALDGFDELVARVGSRDAFQRITELLDQLRGSGTVILSARESFFELFQITSAIRSYLRPKVGSYSVSILRLEPWSEVQGKLVFAALRMPDPDKELASLMAAFDGDHDLVLQPFFLTRLATRWAKGERFGGAEHSQDEYTRIKFIVEQLVVRETNEKWSPQGTPLLDVHGHTTVLSVLAEEMWRSGAFRMSAEEIRLAAQIALQPLNLAPELEQAVLARMPTHAALIPKDKGFAFLHDRILNLYLGFRICEVIRDRSVDSFVAILRSREIPPTLSAWVSWLADECHLNVIESVSRITDLTADHPDFTVRHNAASLIAALLNRNESPASVKHAIFFGDALASKSFKAVTYSNCEFWQVDLSGSTFADCRFDRCRFDMLLVDIGTLFPQCAFEACSFTRIEEVDGRMIFAPDEIEAWLTDRGAEIVHSTQEPPPTRRRRVGEEVVEAVTKLVKMSEKTCDVAVEAFQRFHPNVADEIIKEAIKYGIVRSVVRSTRGPRKDFVRFQVDRERLLKAAIDRIGDEAVDCFWEEFELRD